MLEQTVCDAAKRVSRGGGGPHAGRTPGLDGTTRHRSNRETAENRPGE